jgi:Cdc6-like AAA superfamily ATPase
MQTTLRSRRIRYLLAMPQAARLLALSIAAQEKGDTRVAQELFELAMEYMERADAVSQQQQQIQPQAEKEQDR